MKKALFILLLLTSMPLHYIAAESKTPNYVYCEIIGTDNSVNNITIDIDFGQKKNFWSLHRNSQPIDQNGEVIKFNSMIDALNYMQKLGWEFTQAYVSVLDGLSKTNVFHYILKKELKDGEPINNGVRFLGEMK